MTYRVLDIERTVDTIRKLQARIEDRFPESGLSAVCAELHTAAVESSANIARIVRPNFWLRAIVGTIIAVMVLVLVYSLSMTNFSMNKTTLADLVTLAEATINDLVLIGAAIFFLVSIEARLDRRQALRDLRELRAIAHVIDMHQLTKDPNRRSEMDTEHSPRQTLTPYELTRYLDYCSEMLALTGKVAALYAQSSDDAVVVATINEVEALTTGLSRKVWQKIMILDRVKEEA